MPVLTQTTSELEIILETGDNVYTVSTNSNKLALTGVEIGSIYVISGEADRIERYIGGAISADQNWLVLRNSWEVFVQHDYSPSAEFSLEGEISGVNANVPTRIGWARSGYELTSDLPNSYTTINYAKLTTPDTQQTCSIKTNSYFFYQGVYQKYDLGYIKLNDIVGKIPDRGKLYLSTIPL